MAKKKRVPKPNAEYALDKPERLYKHRILAFDPGSRNMGISCVAVDKKDRVHVLANSIMMKPITTLVDNYTANRQAFIDEVVMWLTTFKPDLIIAERFQTRGNMGPLIELVSTMNAVIGMLAINTPFKFITAATWKNSFHRRFQKTQLDDLYKRCRTAPHPFDATLIGVYGLELALGRELKYGPKSIIQRVEDSSRLKLRTIRLPKSIA